jgi:hypothetical protein
MVVIIGQKPENTALPMVAPDPDVLRVFGEMTDSGTFRTRREALKATAERLGISVRSVYAALERVKN